MHSRDSTHSSERLRMAQGNRPSNPRKSKATRRAAERELAQRQAEQQAREHRQQTIIGIIVTIIIVALVAVVGVVVYRNTHKSQTTQTQSTSSARLTMRNSSIKPTNASDDGGILFSKNGYGKKITGAPTISIYMDPLCPGCGNFNRQTDPTLISLFKAGQINLDIHPMSFLDSSSTDDYSSRAANSIAYIADNDSNPAHLLTYISNIYAEDFQPEEGSSYKSVSDAKLKKEAIKSGVPKSVANKAFNRTYQKWLDAVNTYTPTRKELWGSSGSMSTPTVTINGTMLNLTDVSSAGLSLKQGILKAIGLKESQIGDSSTMPSIGSKGEPVDVTSD